MRKPAKLLTAMLLMPLFAGCASDGVVSRKPTCPVFPVPSDHVVKVMREVRSIDNQVNIWWVDLAQFAVKCEAIRTGK